MQIKTQTRGDEQIRAIKNEKIWKKCNFEWRFFIFTLTIILDVSFGWQDKKKKLVCAHILISYHLLQAVSIFIDMDESGARANEWIYK